MRNIERVDHRTYSQRVYNDALKTAMSDRDMLPDRLLTHDSLVSDGPPELSDVYDSYSWAAHSLKARSWLQAAFIFNFFLMPFDYFVSNSLLLGTLIIRGVIVSSILFGLYTLWGRQRAHWVQGATLLAVSVVITLEAAAIGAIGGVLVFERYLTAGLITVSTAILFFPIQFSWTVTAVVAAIFLHASMLAIGPVTHPALAIATSLFYGCAIFTFATTRKATLRSQWKSFKSKIREMRDQETLTQLYAELQLVADLDPLTGIQNRRSAQTDIERMWTADTGAKSAIAFLMIDIDDFKKLNDTLGHTAGDDCIKAVANAIHSSLRDGDIASRYGGEEFLVVLADTSESNAFAVAERIRKSIWSLKLENPGGVAERRVSVSIGVALWDGDQTPQSLIIRADEALYAAKHKGKNQSVIGSAKNAAPSNVDAHSGQDQKQKSRNAA